MSSSDHVIDFDEMVGGEYDFYGVEGQCFKLDSLIYEAIEDDHSVLGSCLDCVEISNTAMIYVHASPIARVVIEEADVGIYVLVDLHDGHEWLRFGTEYRCDERGRVVGQSFVFEYTTKDVEG